MALTVTRTDIGTQQIATYSCGIAGVSKGERIQSSDSTNPGTWSYDNLNRILTSPQGSYTSDILGNRLTGPGGVTMGWNCLNRMTSLINSSGTTNYSYRADGMRVYKSGAFGSSTSYYDGQMPFETTDVATSGTTVTDNAIGPRGIDAMIVTTSIGAATSFPL